MYSSCIQTLCSSCLLSSLFRSNDISRIIKKTLHFYNSLLGPFMHAVYMFKAVFMPYTHTNATIIPIYMEAYEVKWCCCCCCCVRCSCANPMYGYMFSCVQNSLVARRKRINTRLLLLFTSYGLLRVYGLTLFLCHFRKCHRNCL